MKQQSKADLIGPAVIGFVALVALFFLVAGAWDIAWTLTDLDDLTGVNPTYIQWCGIIAVWASFFAALSSSLGDS